MMLRPSNCTIHIFDLSDGSLIDEHILPVDTAASTLANAASFKMMTQSGGAVEPVAF